jgi:hypothetical protein
MKLRSKLFALMGAGALVLGIAGTAFASTGNVVWTGQGVENGALKTVDCDSNDGQPYLYWVLSPSTNISAAELWVNGQDMGAMDGSDGNTFKLQTDFFDLSTLDAQAAITYSGGLSEGLNLKISHGCPGTESTPPSEGPSFGGSVGDITDAPTEPNTATIGTSNGGPTDSSWLFIAAIGVLLASVVVMTPARAKSKR